MLCTLLQGHNQTHITSVPSWLVPSVVVQIRFGHSLGNRHRMYLVGEIEKRVRQDEFFGMMRFVSLLFVFLVLLAPSYLFTLLGFYLRLLS